MKRMTFHARFLKIIEFYEKIQTFFMKIWYNVAQ